jgi:ubiquinone biosynthesis O-methyltransferase
MQEGKQFDMVTSMEVIEHVESKDLFIASISSKLKENGYLFMSTLDKSWESYLKAIVAAEYIIGIVPLQTHDWNLFISPEDLSVKIRKNHLEILKIQGAEYSFLSDRMTYSSNKTNYMIAAKKVS